MKQVIIVKDPFNSQGWQIAHVDDVAGYLLQQYPQGWPATARIYLNYIAISNDVTPCDGAGVDYLQSLEGTLYVVEYPQGIIAMIAISIVVSLAVAFLIPVPAVGALNNNVQQSPNNELSSRANKPRIKGRIPDIFGTVWSTPDLIAVPYSVYENNREMEYCTMCIGLGEFYIYGAYDDKTQIKDIEGSSAQFYKPNTDITGTPFYSEGEIIESDPLWVQKSNSVNGQVIPPPNSAVYDGSNKTDVYFEQFGVVKINTSKSSSEELAALDLRELFQANDRITIQNAEYQYVETDFLKTGHLDGTYTIGTVDQYSLTLSDYNAVRPNDWQRLQGLDGNRTQDSDAILSGEGGAAPFVGSFIIDQDGGIDRLIFNFVALNGLYADNGSRKQNLSITLDIEINYKLTESTEARAPEHVQVTLTGNGQQTIGKTLIHELDPVTVNYYSVNVARLTGTDHGFGGSVVDEVKWSALYSARPFPSHVFEDETIVRSRTIATAGALAVKERKLNALVTRKLQSYRTGLPGPVFAPTNNAADIIMAIALDPYIGRRTLADMDAAELYAVGDEIEDYFGTPLAAELSCTLDKENLSFEETLATLAQAIFCTFYRQGNVIRPHFERETDETVLLFNSRNKSPSSPEKRTISFAIDNNYDGVEYEYTDPDDDSRVVYYIPSDKSATNPKKVESVGVRNKVQAHLNAWRIWNKLKYQRTTLEFVAHQESDILTLWQRILVANNTSNKSQDGEVLEQTGLVLTTDSEVNFEAGKDYAVFIQLPSGITDNIPCFAGSTNRQILLDRPPLEPLSLDYVNAARATYMLVADDDTETRAFLLAEKSSDSKTTNLLKCVNYDARYYSNDTDQINGLIS